MRKIIVSCVLSLLLSACLSEATEPEWEFLREEDGIHLYKSEAPGMNFDAYKAETVLDSRIEVIGIILRDVPAYSDWMPNCQQARIIEKFDEQNFITHQINKTPWPLKSRDTVVKAGTTIDWESGLFEIELQAVEDPRVPPHPNRVRIEKMKGAWQVQYLDRERTRVSYMMSVDPGGSVPKSMANKRLGNGPLTMLKSLRKAVRNPDYLETAKQSPDRKKIEEYIKLGFLRE